MTFIFPREEAVGKEVAAKLAIFVCVSITLSLSIYLFAHSFIYHIKIKHLSTIHTPMSVYTITFKFIIHPTFCLSIHSSTYPVISSLSIHSFTNIRTPIHLLFQLKVTQDLSDSSILFLTKTELSKSFIDLSLLSILSYKKKDVV